LNKLKGEERGKEEKEKEEGKERKGELPLTPYEFLGISVQTPLHITHALEEEEKEEKEREEKEREEKETGGGQGSARALAPKTPSPLPPQRF